MSNLRFTLITSGFYLGEDYFAQNLCENTDRPELQCHGSCVLQKSIKSASQHEDQDNGKSVFIDYLTKFNYLETDLLIIIFGEETYILVYPIYAQVIPHQEFEKGLLIPPEKRILFTKIKT
ncbi:hypothetical protein [Flexithrix dorotheae]|uniref:hypothetical protein n=1 Tax=Flexithrix dorotheae TaxID=70993 RepID=UPI000365560F|nr:hypothetical protein [Flexithrix dorotheae]